MNKLENSFLAAALATQACSLEPTRQLAQPQTQWQPPHAVRVCERIGDQIACTQGIGQFSPEAAVYGWEDAPVDETRLPSVDSAVIPGISADTRVACLESVQAAKTFYERHIIENRGVKRDVAAKLAGKMSRAMVAACLEGK